MSRNFTELFMSWDWFQLSASEWKTPSWGTQTIICFNYQEAENIFGKLYFFSGTMFIQILCLFAVFVPCDNRWALFSPHNQHPSFQQSFFFFSFFFSAVWWLDRVYCFFGWRSQLDLWEGWVSYCLICCVLMECRNLYASFHSSFIAIDFWLSPLPVLKGDVAAEKMSVSQ